MKPNTSVLDSWFIVVVRMYVYYCYYCSHFSSRVKPWQNQVAYDRLKTYYCKCRMKINISRKPLLIDSHSWSRGNLSVARLVLKLIKIYFTSNNINKHGFAHRFYFLSIRPTRTRMLRRYITAALMPSDFLFKSLRNDYPWDDDRRIVIICI